MFSFVFAFVFVVLSAVLPAPRLPAVLYEDGSALWASCSVSALAHTGARLVLSDPAVVLDSTPDSPIANLVESWRVQCSWRVLPPAGPIGAGLALVAVPRKRQRRIWLGNPTPECGSYNLSAFPTRADVLAYLRDCFEDDDSDLPRDSYGRFVQRGPVEGIHYWPITESDVPAEDWADYVEECASY